MPGIRPFDARALLVPADPAAARAYTERLRTEGRVRDGGTTVAVVVFVVLIAVVGAIALGGMLLTVVLATTLQAGAALLGILLVIPLLLCVAGLVVGMLLSMRAQRRQLDRRWRLARFAQDVGMEYVPLVLDPPLPGSIFGVGSGRRSTDVLRGRHPRFVEVGDYQCTVHTGKTTTTVNWGYLAIKLNVPLPHIVLDASGNGISLGSFGRDQHLSLEGDFDRYFRLYCPEGYERDALYLFTPDVMARFIDTAAVLDVEIVDDWLLLYSSGGMSSTDPARWAWIFSVIAALLDKLAQWERWRDDRLLGEVAPFGAGVAAVPASAAPGGAASTPSAPAFTASAPPAFLAPPPGVAPPGRRLRRGVPWVVLAIIGGMAAVGAIAVGAVALLPLLFFR